MLMSPDSRDFLKTLTEEAVMASDALIAFSGTLIAGIITARLEISRDGFHSAWR